MSSYALWRRALRRVERRARTYLAFRHPVMESHCADCERAYQLLREAARLANGLAPVR